MRNAIFLAAAAAVLAAALSGCGRGGAGSFAPEGEALFDGSGSYALGMDIGTSLRMSGIFPDLDEFARGVRDALVGETRYTMDEAVGIIQAAHAAMVERRGEANRLAGEAFLAGNALRPGVSVTASGLQYEAVVRGDGPLPGIGDVVLVHYEGSLIDGSVFDSSRARGVPAEFPVGGLIAGWTEGLQLMGVGSTFRFFIPPELGYGAMGMGPLIPPHSTLLFEVELLGIVGLGD